MLTSNQIHKLANLYHLETYLFHRVSARFANEQTLTPFDFFAIIVWKSNRNKTRVKKGLKTAKKTVENLMREVAQASSPLQKMKLLTDIEGIGISVASAILAVCYPLQFTVLDYRAWDTLSNWDLDELAATIPATPVSYLEYCEVCRRLAARNGVSLRELDRALWAKSWSKDLADLIDGLEA